MGIYQLRNFVNEVVPEGSIDVSIVDECIKFSLDNSGKKPILVIDLNGFMTIINADMVKTLYGRSHRQCFETIDNLFRRLSELAVLVFFEDGPVMEQKTETFMERRNDSYQRFIDVIDRVNQHVPLARIVEERVCRQTPFIGSGFEFLSELVAKYGERIVSVTKECDAEVARFACNDLSVIAVIAEDSDFLIFPGHWKYFSIASLNLETLATKEYSRTALREFLDLNDQEMAIFATIAGNDIMRYKDVKHCHGHKIGNYVKFNEPLFRTAKFPRIADKVQTMRRLRTQEIISDLACFLLGDESENFLGRVADSIDQYNVDFLNFDDLDATPLLKFCRENRCDFVFSVLERKPLKMVVGFYERRVKSWPNFFEVLKKLTKRQIGIVLQHQRSSNQVSLRLEIKAKKSHEEPMQTYSILPDYPAFRVPDLMELIDRAHFPQLDNARFELLKWTISDTLRDVDVTFIPKTYLRHVLTLHFMVAEGFITKFDADIILLTIKDAEQGNIPNEYEYPPVVDPSAFQIAHVFLDFFIDIQRSFEIVGLSDLVTLQSFEGGWFHRKYIDFSSSGRNSVHDLENFVNYRIYKDLPDKASALSLKV